MGILYLRSPEPASSAWLLPGILRGSRFAPLIAAVLAAGCAKQHDLQSDAPAPPAAGSGAREESFGKSFGRGTMQEFVPIVPGVVGKLPDGAFRPDAIVNRAEHMQYGEEDFTVPQVVYEFLECDTLNPYHAQSLFHFKGALEVWRSILEEQGNLSTEMQGKLEKIKDALQRIEERFGPVMRRERDLDELSRDLPEILRVISGTVGEDIDDGITWDETAQSLMRILRKDELLPLEIELLGSLQSAFERKLQELPLDASVTQKGAIDRVLKVMEEKLDCEEERLKEERERQQKKRKPTGEEIVA